MLCWLILPLQLFLRNQVGESSKEGIQTAWSTLIYHINSWISRFRGVCRSLTASEGKLFLILLKNFQSLFNITRSFVLVVVDILYLPLHFIIVVVIIVIMITFFVNMIAIIFIVIIIFIKSSLMFLWAKLTVWFCFFQFLHLS